MGGIKSTHIPERFDLVPFEGVRSAARRFAYGAKKYAERNWESANESGAKDRLNHLVRHCILFAQFRRWEDLDALLCNGMMMAYYKEKGLLEQIDYDVPVKDKKFVYKEITAPTSLMDLPNTKDVCLTIVPVEDSTGTP